MFFDWARFIIAAICIVLGIIIEIIAIIGIYRFKYILNRMHASAIGDTLGLYMILFGLMIISGFNFTTLKMLLVMGLFMCTSSVASHLIARMEVETNKEVTSKVEVIDNDHI